MSNKLKQAEKTISEEIKQIKLRANTKSGKALTGPQLEKKIKDAKIKELRKETEKQRKAYKQASKERKAKLVYHYNELKSYGMAYVTALSLEIGRPITCEEIQALKYSHFLPFLTESEDLSNTLHGWNDERFTKVVARYFRNEAKNKVTESILTEFE